MGRANLPFVFLVVAGCSDDPIEPLAPPASVIEASSGPTRDAGIDPNDTYLVFDVSMSSPSTLTLPQPVYNPTTQTYQTEFSIQTRTALWHVEFGYDATGEIRTSLYNDAVIDISGLEGHQTDVIRVIGDSIFRYDQFGVLIPNTIAAVSGQTLPVFPALVQPSGPIPSSVVLDSMPSSAAKSGAIAVIASPPGGQAATKRYEQVGGHWLLTEITLEDPSGQREPIRLLLNNHRWNRNHARDEGRRARGSDPRPDVDGDLPIQREVCYENCWEDDDDGNGGGLPGGGDGGMVVGSQLAGGWSCSTASSATAQLGEQWQAGSARAIRSRTSSFPA